MAVVWTVEHNDARGSSRSITIKRVVDGNESTAQTLSETFHRFNDSKVEIKARFKKMFLEEKAKEIEARTVLKDSDLVNFETEVNS